MPPLNLIRCSGVSYSRSLVRNLAFLIFFYSKAIKTGLVNKKILLVYKLTIPKFVGLLRLLNLYTVSLRQAIIGLRLTITTILKN